MIFAHDSFGDFLTLVALKNIVTGWLVDSVQNLCKVVFPAGYLWTILRTGQLDQMVVA